MLRTLASLTLALAAGPGLARADAALLVRSAPILSAGVRPLTLETVDRVVESNDRMVQSCSRSRSRARDTLAVLIRLEIDPDGRVSGAEASLPSAESRCVERIAKRLRFPAAGTVTRLEFPFLLAPRH